MRQELDGHSVKLLKFDKSEKALYLNYSLTFSHSTTENSFASINSLHYLSDKGKFQTSFFTNLFSSSSETNAKKLNKIIRLESNFISNNVDNLSKLTIGDATTRSANWSGSTRFLGVKYSTNFSLKPDIILTPLQNFIGTAELPSTVEILVDNNSIYSKDVRSGPFEITNIPITTGTGDMIVRMKDITGRIQTIIVPFYSVPSLLAKNISDYSFEIGFQRQNFGIESNNYKNLLISFDYKKGINNSLTSGYHFEFLKNQASLGFTNIFKLWNLGYISTSIATNIDKSIKSKQKFNIAYHYSGKKINFNINYLVGGSKYIDALNPTSVGSANTLQVSINYPNKKLGNFSLNYISSTSKNFESSIISANYSKNILKNISTIITCGTDLKNKDNNFLTLSLNTNILDHSVSLSQTRSKNSASTQGSISSKSKMLGWGYTGSFSKNDDSLNYSTSVSNSNKYFNSKIYITKSSNKINSQFLMDGSLILAGNNLFIAPIIYDSFAIVKTGKIANVPIYSNNQFVGYTNNKGNLLVTNIIAFTPSTITMDENHMSLDTAYDSVSKKIYPKSNSAVIVDFNVTIVKQAEVILVDENNQPIEFDRRLDIEGLEGEDIFTSYDGLVYIKDIKNLTKLKGKACVFEENTCCNFDHKIDLNQKNDVLKIGKVTCK
jgi:outer membrane usher protein FimD/PapC